MLGVPTLRLIGGLGEEDPVSDAILPVDRAARQPSCRDFQSANHNPRGISFKEVYGGLAGWTQEVAMTAVALYVELKAKPGKEDAVAAFLADAKDLVDAEPGTISWFAVRFDQSTFAIFDAFDNDAGREAHLSGKVAAALMENAGELLTAAPQIRKADVLADKLPG